MIDTALNIINTYFHYIIIYIVIGVAYTFLKWVLSLVKLRRKVEAITEKEIAEEMKRWNKDSDESMRSLRKRKACDIFGNSSYPPKAADNIALIVAWGIFWPINAVWTMFHDVLTEAFNFIVRKIAGIYNAISLAILPK